MSAPITRPLAIVVLWVATATAFSPQNENPRVDWVGPATGHRIVRLSDEPGSSTLYFHDNAFSAAGDKLLVRTPKGIAIGDVARIGTPDFKLETISEARGGYFARRGRHIYLSAGAGNSGGGRGEGPIRALNVDTRIVRDVPHARGLVNADETISVHKNARAVDAEGKHPAPPTRPIAPQLQRMFPGERMEDLTPEQQYAVTKEDQLAPLTIDVCFGLSTNLGLIPIQK